MIAIKYFIKFLTTIIPVIIIIKGCSEKSVQPNPEKSQWISGIPFYFNFPSYREQIEHDDRILESANFLTFSDASSDEIKILYSQIAEQAFDEIKEAFEINSSEELGIYINNTNTKLTIYSDRYLNKPNISFPIGFLLIALDSPIAQSWFGNDQDQLQ